MVRLISLLLLAGSVAAAAPAPAAEDRGPGIVGERQGDGLVYRVANFRSVAIGTSGTADVRVGPAWSLRIAGPAAALANLRVVVKDGRLEIGKRDPRRRDEGDERIVIALTLPRLDDAALGGSGRFRIDRIAGGDFSAAVGGSGDLSIGALNADKAVLSIGGSGSIRAAGRVRDVAVNIGGSGRLDAPALVASKAEVAAAGSGGARISVDGPATVSLVGSGLVDLGLKARCSVTRMGSGRVICGR
jgi:hypothetical protein